MDEVSLGRRLQSARKSAGFTQQRLCHDAGLSYSTLAKIERGAIKSPSIFTIQRIAEVLGTSLDSLIGHSSKKPAKTAKKRSKNGVRFVYFDINGCLVRFFHRAFTMVAEDTGVSPDIIETAFWHYNDNVCCGKMSLKDFNKKMADRLGVKELDWQKYYMASVDPIEEMHQLIGWAAQHYQVGLLSNIMPGFIPAMRASGLIPDIDYDVIIDSSEVGAIKPEPKIYEVASSKAGVEPGEILLIDDSRTNLMAAERFGWHVLWFDDFNPHESAAKVKKALEL